MNYWIFIRDKFTLFPGYNPLYRKTLDAIESTLTKTQVDYAIHSFYRF